MWPDREGESVWFRVSVVLSWTPNKRVNEVDMPFVWMGKHRGVAERASRSQGAGFCWDGPEGKRTRDPRYGWTKDEGRVLTFGGTGPPSTRTLAVSEPVGRGREPTSLAESVSIREPRSSAGEPTKTPLDKAARDRTRRTPQYHHRRLSWLCHLCLSAQQVAVPVWRKRHRNLVFVVYLPGIF